MGHLRYKTQAAHVKLQYLRDRQVGNLDYADKLGAFQMKVGR